MSGLIAWEGPSRFDAAPIVLVLTGLAGESRNPKTGHMVQSYIIRSDENPIRAVETGRDSAICGGCQMRSDQGMRGRRCYVNVAQGPLRVFRLLPRYDRPSLEDAARRIAGLELRIGTYGDPAAVPFEVWQKLLRWTAGHTGYTHAWRTAPELRPIVMASVDSPAERREAQALGWRTFRVRRVRARSFEPLEGSEVVCPASREAGHRSTCQKCGLCAGANKQARSVAIVDHSAIAIWARRRLEVLQ